MFCHHCKIAVTWLYTTLTLPGDEENFNLMLQESVRLVLKFTVVVYAEFENVIEIDRNRNAIYYFGA